MISNLLCKSPDKSISQSWVIFQSLVFPGWGLSQVNRGYRLVNGINPASQYIYSTHVSDSDLSGVTIKDQPKTEYRELQSPKTVRFFGLCGATRNPCLILPGSHFLEKLQTGSVSLRFKYQSLGSQVLPIFYFRETGTGTPHNSLAIEIDHRGSTNASNKRLYFTIVNKGLCFDLRINLIEDQ